MDVPTKSLWGAHQQNGCHIRSQHWCMCHVSLFSVDWRFFYSTHARVYQLAEEQALSLHHFISVTCDALCLKKRNYFSWSWLCINSLLFVLSFNMGLVIGKQPPLSCHILIRNSTRHLLRDTHPWHKFHVIIQVPNEVCRNCYGCRG